MATAQLAWLAACDGSVVLQLVAARSSAITDAVVEAASHESFRLFRRRLPFSLNHIVSVLVYLSIRWEHLRVC